MWLAERAWQMVDAFLDLKDDTQNPLDLVERVVTANEWPFSRPSEAELGVEVGGTWCEYRLWFLWRHELGSMNLSCAFDIRIPEARRGAVYPLLAMINERLWLGHFDLWAEDGLLMFRHGVLTRGGPRITDKQIESLVETAISECERFYPAFQFVIWGGKDAAEAMAAAVLEPVGEA